ncbi:GPP34 family phosphoprotein [Actinoplanes sp. TRM 88003]|uniref:GPP34 family phosphoprotein n=1 Tax=Paractinoplanes aksuensis TaxID=2939490 RepID=A0ABT1E371_9ACTN|nr:GPP34 family phosphoprotein [Actinoplanes aksuensis]MCO8276266.1 GPP34 family phosphoprotein [Actinoplanes aksuensis]
MTPRIGPPTLAEDVLLVLHQFRPGPEALAGAVLADLSLGEHVRTLPGRGGSTRVEAVAERPPADDILRSAWEFLRSRPRGVQAALAEIGPTLLGPVRQRLMRRGDVNINPDALAEPGARRRGRLLSGVREMLVDGKAEAPQRIAALAALISASGMLRRLDPEIPWTPAVVARAERLENDVWGARAVAEALARSVAAALAGNMIVAAAVLQSRDRC